MEYDDKNRGVLFPQDNVEGKRPQYKGSLNTDCPHCGGNFDRDLAGWKRTGKNSGKQFLSLSVSEPWKKDPVEKYRDAAQPVMPDDDLPF